MNRGGRSDHGVNSRIKTTGITGWKQFRSRWSNGRGGRQIWPSSRKNHELRRYWRSRVGNVYSRRRVDSTSRSAWTQFIVFLDIQLNNRPDGRKGLSKYGKILSRRRATQVSVSERTWEIASAFASWSKAIIAIDHHVISDQVASKLVYRTTSRGWTSAVICPKLSEMGRRTGWLITLEVRSPNVNSMFWRAARRNRTTMHPANSIRATVQRRWKGRPSPRKASLPWYLQTGEVGAHRKRWDEHYIQLKPLRQTYERLRPRGQEANNSILCQPHQRRSAASFWTCPTCTSNRYRYPSNLGSRWTTQCQTKN